MLEPIGRLSGVGLNYPKLGYKTKMLREAFIDFFRSPLSALSSKTETRTVLADLNLEIHKGDRIALFGVNGAGKTTLCRLLGGCLEPTRGAVVVPEDTRALFYASTALYPDLSGRDNAEIALALLFPQMKKQERAELLEDAIVFSELVPDIDSLYRTYSTGMQARLMLSLATSRPAELLILDEVFESADLFWRSRIAARTENMINQSGALIFASHSPELAERICRSAWVLHEGRVRVFDKLEEGLRFFHETHRAG